MRELIITSFTKRDSLIEIISSLISNYNNGKIFFSDDRTIKFKTGAILFGNENEFSKYGYQRGSVIVKDLTDSYTNQNLDLNPHPYQITIEFQRLLIMLSTYLISALVMSIFMFFAISVGTQRAILIGIFVCYIALPLFILTFSVYDLKESEDHLREFLFDHLFYQDFVSRWTSRKGILEFRIPDQI